MANPLQDRLKIQKEINQAQKSDVEIAKNLSQILQQQLDTSSFLSFMC